MRPLLRTLAIATAGLVAGWPGLARGSGGVFCDSGPQLMPIDQSGENVLFVIEQGQVELHIQINYAGEPAEFAWIIPLSEVPQFSVGSDALFNNLLAATAPTYGFTTRADDCNVPMVGPPTPTGDDAGGLDDGAQSGPEVVLEQSVGAYDIAVLQGGTSTEVLTWLDANGYQQDTEATPILHAYLQEGYLFGAIKLSAGAGLDQIHPIVLRFPGSDARVPLRLTRIAAVQDMEVRAFFLADHRVVPTNYRHVLLNPLQIDWLARGANYEDVVAQAVDVEHADGRAFVTEYAGPSGVVAQDGLIDPRWDPEAFRTASLLRLLGLLQDQGLVACVGGAEGCVATHPLIDGLLAQVVLPPGVSLAQLAACPECYEDTWQPDLFADAFAERIVAPGEHAMELLRAWPYVSRLYTTISPHEMTDDPSFHERTDLDDVPTQRIADRRVRCDDDSIFRLPDGREVYVPDGAPWPDFASAMPLVEEVTALPVQGEPTTLVQNTEAIDVLLAEYNAEHDWPAEGCFACRSGDRRSAASWLFVIVAMFRRRR